MQSHRVEEDRERGAALAIVFLFMLLLMGMVTILLLSSQRSAAGTSADLRSREMQLVLRSGVAEALSELSSGVDSGADGVGAIGGDATGLEVSVDGRTLGVVRVIVDSSDPDRVVLRAVAAWPSLAAPRSTAAAEILLTRDDPTAVFGNDGPLIFSGPMGDTSKIRPDGEVTITDPTQVKPALNVEDSSLLADFIADFVNDPEVSLFGLGGTGEDTTTSIAGNALDNAALDSIANSLFDYASNVTPDGTIVGDKSGGAKITVDHLNVGGAGQVTYFGGANNMRIESGATVTGSGTLIINRRLEVDDGGTLIWDGDVIVLGAQNHAKLEVQDGTIQVTGNLIAVPDPSSNKRADIRVSSDGNLTVKGSLLTISAGTGEAEFHIDGSGGGSSGADVNVDGVLAMLGDKIDFRIGGGGKSNEKGELTVKGGMVFAVPTGDPDGLKRFRFDSDSTTTITYDAASYADAVNGLSDFLTGLPTPPEAGPWKRSGYLELPSAQVIAAQAAALAVGTKIDAP